jgi:outer membrane protein OmpA-like peptidoglycan-associated protein
MSVRWLVLAASVAMVGLSIPGGATACTPHRFRIHFAPGEAAFPSTDEARDEIASFHRYVTSDADQSVVIVGHVDRLGSPDEQVERSRLMAMAVSSELERLGLPRSAITLRSMGSREMIRPTPEGESEPLNRRVELFSMRPVDMARACPGLPPPPGRENE